jgi:hypothetical protein
MRGEVVHRVKLDDHTNDEGKSSKSSRPRSPEHEPEKRDVEGDGNEKNPEVSPVEARLDIEANAQQDGDQKHRYLQRSDRDSDSLPLHGIE